MNLKKQAFAIALLLLISANIHHCFAQIFQINYIHSKLTTEDTATLNRMGRFEVNFYNQVFNTKRNDSAKVVIDLYGRQGEYNKVQKAAMNTTFIDGFYSPFENKIFLYKSDHYINTLFHETSHALLRNNFPNPPKWLNEGIATMMGYLVETTDNEVYSVPQHSLIKMLRDSIHERSFNFNDYFRYKASDWTDKDKRPMLYATAYGIIYFFVNQRKDHLSSLLVLMQKGYSTRNALIKEFGSLENFEREFFYFYMMGDGRKV